MKMFVAALLGHCNDYSEFEKNIEAKKELKEKLNLDKISGSQISRRINDMPTEWAQDLFVKSTQMVQELTSIVQD